MLHSETTCKIREDKKKQKTKETLFAIKSKKIDSDVPQKWSTTVFIPVDV